MTAAPSVRARIGHPETLPAERPLNGRAHVQTGLTRALAWFERPSVAYVLIVLVQLKVIWNDWKLRDLTSGDTSAYFQNATRWAERGMVDILWSPLYTSFYGTILMLIGDAASTTWIHRTLITFTTT